MSKHALIKNKKPSTRNVGVVGIMAICIVVCLAFSAGFMMRGDDRILEALGFTSLVEKSEESQALVSTDATLSLSAHMAEVESIIKNESMDSFDLGQATSTLLMALTESNDDEYLRYYDQDRYMNYVKEGSGKYAGVGVLFSEHNGEAYVVDVFPGSVAESAGVEVGDFVSAINGDSSQAWSLTEAVHAVSKGEGESVVITWRRADSLDATGGRKFTTTLQCHVYDEPNVVTEINDGVGYIKLTQITQNSANLTREVIENLSKQGATSFVLDLRNNPGGYLTQAVDIASLFIKSGVVVSVETRDAQSSINASTTPTVTDRPLVVLVNENTAAAAEVIAAALKDNERATIIGTKTLGKGSVQVVKALSFGGALRYTAAYYKTPLGHDIDGLGVSPDITVNKGKDPVVDNQKELAIEAVRSLAEG